MVVCPREFGVSPRTDGQTGCWINDLGRDSVRQRLIPTIYNCVPIPVPRWLGFNVEAAANQHATHTRIIQQLGDVPSDFQNPVHNLLLTRKISIACLSQCRTSRSRTRIERVATPTGTWVTRVEGDTGSVRSVARKPTVFQRDVVEKNPSEVAQDLVGLAASPAIEPPGSLATYAETPSGGCNVRRYG